MILRGETLDGIRRGVVTLAFRRWRRPTVRTGGTLLTASGQLRITSVTPVVLADISAGDARRAGFDTRAALVRELERQTAGAIYRIEFGALGVDPRVALRESPAAGATKVAPLVDRLRRLDARAGDRPWTRQTLELIAAHAGLRAADLCVLAGQDKMPFKVNVRKLKAMGLTESLEVGYRLSPRGEALLATLRDGWTGSR